MNELEKDFIVAYNTLDKDFGYNVSEGGDTNPMLGKHHSKETKQKLSEARKGKFLGENNSFFGKHHTDETKKKISEAKKGKCAGENAYWYGKHHSEETKKKMSEAKKGKLPINAKPVICLETKEIFQSTGLAAKAMNLKNSRRIYIACIDNSRTSGGYHWKYLEDYNKENDL